MALRSMIALTIPHWFLTLYWSAVIAARCSDKFVKSRRQVTADEKVG